MPDFNPDQFIADADTPAPTPEAQQTPASFDPSAFVSQTYGTPIEQLKTAAEGAAESATFGLSDAVEQAAGVKPEDIAARRAENPLPHAGGSILSLVAQMATGVGEGKLIASAGEGAAKLVGLGAPASFAAKIGSAAVQGAAESALLSGGDEVSKALTDPDPSKVAETAMSNIGLSAVLGGGLGAGFGVAGSLWRATVGNQVGGVLDAVAAHTGGFEGEAVSPLADAAAKAGVDLPPAIQGTLTGGGPSAGYGLDLAQSDATAAGREYQASLLEAKRATGDAVARAVGYDPAEVLERPALSKYDAGYNVGNTLADELDTGLSPLSAQFEAIKDRYGSLPLVEGSQGNLSDQIAKLAQEQGWAKSPSSAEMGLTQRVLKELPLQETLGDISKYITRVGNMGQEDVLNRSLSRAAGMIKGILKNEEANTIASHITLGEGQGASAEFEGLRTAWAKQSSLVDAVNDRLGIKTSVSNFPTALRDMAKTDGEAILRKLNVGKDANLIDVLQQSFPQTAQALRDAHTGQLFENASKDFGGVSGIDAPAVLKRAKALSPEMQQFLFNPETASKLNAAGQVAEALKPPSTYNYSNTARTLSKTLGSMGSSAMGLITMLAGHGPIAALGVGTLTRMLSKDAPDAAKLALLKFLGSKAPVSSEGFQAMTSFIAKANRGNLELNRFSKALLEGTKTVLPVAIPKGNIDRLKDRLDQVQEDPQAMVNLGGSLGHYLPEHQTAMAMTSQRAINYLEAQRPTAQRNGILDREAPVSPAREAAYNRTLQIAEQPGIIYRYMSDGSLSSKDMQDFNAMYPNLHQQVVQKITEQMVNKLSNGGTVPYTLRRGLSLLTGQPMDSTFTPQAIQAAQATYPVSQPPPGPQQGQGKPKAKGSTSKLGKMAENAQTPAQARTVALNKP